jgi:hypothetical protein
VFSRSLRRALLSGAAAAVPLAVALSVATSAGAASTPGWQVSATVSTASEPSVNMTGLDASGPGNAWAVGTTDESLMIEHWSKGQWQPVRAPAATNVGDAGGSVNDQVIGTSSATNTWIFPNVNDAWSAFRWNGRKWARFKLAAAATITGTAVSGPADVWAFGAKAAPAGSLGYGPPYAAHYNGHAWRQIPMPGVPLEVSKVSGSDIWAVGPTAQTAGEAGTSWVWIAMHWNGKTWHSISLPQPPPVQGYAPYPQAVAALSASNVWVVDVPSAGLGGGPVLTGTTLLHWNGQRWSQVSQDASIRANGLAPDGHGGVWLTDENASFTGSDLIHYSDGAWTSQSAASQPGDTTQLGPLVKVPGTGTLWAAGQLVSGNLPGPGVILRDGS